MTARGCVLLVLLAIVLGGCGGDGDGSATQGRDAPRADAPERAHAPERLREARGVPAVRGSAAEQRWRNALLDFHRELGRALRRIGSAHADDDPSERTVERVEEALETLRTCGDDLRETLARPPDARHRRTVQLLQQACRAFRAGAEADARALVADTEALVSAARRWSEGTALLAQANRALPRPLPIDALPLPSVGAAVSFSRVEPELTRAAREVLGRDAEARCWSEPDWKRLVAGQQDGGEGVIWAYAVIHTSTVHLSPWVCDDLNALLYGGARPDDDDELLLLAASVQTFAHEVLHLAEGSNEAVVECVAIQRVRPIAELLGLDEEEGARLAEAYWEEIYPDMPAEYRSDACRPGGPLDREPERDEWP
ncbi:MAG TPA: hypothetical protein VM290_10590 [Gaiellaceae bacterium]|nr:hypothetical protein [Gaiellaceae bacterium]